MVVTSSVDEDAVLVPWHRSTLIYGVMAMVVSGLLATLTWSLLRARRILGALHTSEQRLALSDGLARATATAPRPNTAAWCRKQEPTFSDAIAAVRRMLWVPPNFASSLWWVASHNHPLIGPPRLPTSWRFLVRLKGAVSSSRPENPQGVRAQPRSMMAARPPRLRGLSLTAASTAPGWTRTGPGAEGQPCVTQLCSNRRWA